LAHATEGMVRMGTGRKWVLIYGLLTLFLTIAIANTWTHSRSGSRNHTSSRDSSHVLGLRVQRNGMRILVTWDRSAPGIANATDANLLIWDGPGQPFYIPLTPIELRAGSMSGTTVNDQVSVRLEVEGASGNAKTDSAVIIAGRQLNSPVLEGAEYSSSTSPRTESDSKLIASQKAKVKSHAVTVLAPVQPPSSAPESSNSPRASPKRVENVRVSPARQAGRGLTAPDSHASSDGSERSRPSTFEEHTRDSTPPEAIRAQRPKIPAEMRSTISSDNVVEVQVRIDESGRLIAATAVSTTGTAAASFVPYALKAAHGWRFKPARQNGKAVRSDKVLQFLFRSSDG
jgi:hypothetical protein